MKESMLKQQETSFFISISLLNGNRSYVPNLCLVPHSSPVFAGKVRASYGTHLLDHLAADGAGFAGGQVTVVTVGQVHANLPWCPFYILNSPNTGTVEGI